MIAAMSTPIFMLPPEILSDILCLAALDSSRSRAHSLDRAAAPWTYARVSRQFRDVAVGLPMLWNRVTLDRFSRDHRSAHNQTHTTTVELLLLQLERAQEMPLDIVIEALDSELSRLLIPPLWSRRHLWRSLTVNHHFFDIYPFFTLPGSESASFPLLEELHTTAHSSEGRELQLQAVTRPPRLLMEFFGSMRNLHVFRDAPRIKRLSIGATPFSMMNSSWTWTNCEDVVIHHLLIEDAPLVLPNALQTCRTLSVQYSGQSEIPTFPRIPSICNAPHLTTLCINSLEAETLDHLTAPSLRHLAVSHLRSADPIRSLVQRSDCHLEFLVIEYSEVSNYSALLDTVPELISLTILEVDSSANFANLVDALQASSGKKSSFLGVPCPQYVPNLLRAWIKPFVPSFFSLMPMDQRLDVLRLRKILLNRVALGPRISPDVEQATRLRAHDLRMDQAKMFESLLPFTTGDLRLMFAV